MTTWATRATKHNRMTELAALEGWKCHYCGVQLRECNEMQELLGIYGISWIGGFEQFVVGEYEYLPTMRPTLDHKIPRNTKKDHSINNLVLCCFACNVEKSHRYSYDEFLAMKRTAKCQTLTQ